MILSLMICETNLILYEKENEMVKDVKVCGHPVYLDKLILVCMTWWHLFLICLHTIISCPKLHNIKPIGIFHLFWLIHLKLFEKYIFSISLFGQVKGCVMYLLNHRNQKKNHFSNKEFEILDLDPPINYISHYGACFFLVIVSL